MSIDKAATPFEKVVMIALLLSPILQSYGWGRFDFASLLTIGLAFIHLLKNGFRNSRLPFWMTIYLLFWYFSHFISNKFPISIFPLGIIRIFVTYIMFYDCFEFNYFIKKYRLFGFVFIAFFFVQTIVRYATGKVLPGMFTFLPMKFSDVSEFVGGLEFRDRDSSFFSEPAHFVQFLLPLLAVELFFYNRKSWPRILAIIITLLLMQSGNALLGLVVFGIAFVIDYFRGKWSLKKILGFSLILLITGLASYYYINSAMGESLLERQDTISSNSLETRGYANSGFVRIYRGYYIYQDYSLLDKFIGNDCAQHMEEVVNHSVYSWTFDDNIYFNTFQSFLVYTGIIGTLIFTIFYIGQWKKTNFCGRTILMVFLALSFISSMHFHEIMAVYMLIPFALGNNDSQKEDNPCSCVKT